jgi:hypothetical protein
MEERVRELVDERLQHWSPKVVLSRRGVGVLAH